MTDSSPQIPHASSEISADLAEPYAHERSFGRPTVGVTLFVAFSIISVSPILLFGLWLSHQQKIEAVAAFDREASIRAQNIEESVREFIQLKREVLDVTAGTLSSMTYWDPLELQKITDAQIKSSGSFDSFYVANPQGVSLVFAPSVREDGTKTRAGVNYSDRDYYRELIKSKRVSIGGMKMGRQSKVANVHVAVPIYQDLDLKHRGELRGFILGGIKTQLIQQLMTRALKGRDQLRALLVEQDQRVIGDSEQRISIFTRLPDDSTLAHKCLTPNQNTLDLDGTPIRVFCKEISIEPLRWTLWMSAPQKLITEAANRSISLTINISILLLIGVILVAGLLSSWVGQLMGLITMNAQRVSSGLFHITLPKVRWFTPREVIEVGNISLKTLARVRESDIHVRQLVRDLEAVNQQQAPLAEAWRQVSEAIEILSPHGEVLFVNPALYELLDLNIENTSPLNRRSQLFDLSSPLTAPRSVGDVIIRHAEAGLPWTGEVEWSLNKRRRVHSVHSSPIFDQHSELSRVVVIRRDITEERIAQASAAHNDRLASIGTLAAGMAHEINNPMTYIKMSLDIIQESLEGVGAIDNKLDEETRHELEDAVTDASEGVDRVTLIVRSLLNIARSGGERGGGEERSEVSLYEVIEACSNLVRSEFSKRVQLMIEVDQSLTVWGRRSELIQVFLNLMINAAQAMPPERTSGHWVKVRGELLESGFIQLTVSDNAKGISPDDLEHIFEPFFSSKPIGQGTGLGLSISRGIIEAHNASIEVASTKGEGSVFTILFPPVYRADQLPSEPLTDTAISPLPITLQEHRRSEMSAQASDHRRKILIVDDDLLVAKSLSKMLRNEQVTITSSGAEALETLKSSAFDLILSDVMMPEMDGPTFYQEVRARYPQYVERFIFITGAAKGGEVEAALNATGRVVLNKPITKGQLVEVVQQYPPS